MPLSGGLGIISLMVDITVIRNDARHRYDAVVDGRVVGFAAYRTTAGPTVFTHTEVDDAHRRQGVGSALAREALVDVRARGDRVVPQCPFIVEYIKRNPDFADVVAPTEDGGT
jgi:predicted GNAT family acetyltransferase